MRFQKTGCSNEGTISQKAVLSSLPDGSRSKEWLEKMDEDQWMITSYDSISRNVCFQVVSESGDLRFFSMGLAKP